MNDHEHVYRGEGFTQLGMGPEAQFPAMVRYWLCAECQVPHYHVPADVECDEDHEGASE